MNPILLQKQFRDNTKDLQDFYKELQEWGDEMKRKDESRKPGASNDAADEVPLPRSKIQKTEGDDAKKPETKKPKRIKSCDYKAWENFDADAYCKRMEKEAGGEPFSDDASDDLSDEFDGSMVEMASCEKEKGNAFVKKQRWDDAMKCYTKAIECYAYDPIFYANRALCHLKMQNFRNAESDCTAALQLDKKYVKAYQRRAAARESLNQLNEARDDLLRVLELEKKNAESKAALVKLEKKIEGESKQSIAADPPRPVSKFTLSRQKQKPPPVPESREEIPAALKPHVVEKLEAPTTGSNLPTKKCEQWWPSGSHVELFESLSRPRKARSVRPLKRIQIVDVDLQTEPQVYDGLTHQGESGTQTTVKRREQETAPSIPLPPLENDEFIDESAEHVVGVLELDESESESKMQASVKRREEETLKLMEQIPLVGTKASIASPPVLGGSVVLQEHVTLQTPKTSVQFYKGWKSVVAGDHDLRLRYLKQITPGDLPNIFKESLESKVFSEMIETLSNAAAQQDRSLIYDWLMHLTNVKRFSTLAMFMSAADKRRVSELFAYLVEDNKFECVGELRRKYEV